MLFLQIYYDLVITQVFFIKKFQIKSLFNIKNTLLFKKIQYENNTRFRFSIG